MIAKEFYRSYIADDNIGELNNRLAHLIRQWKPIHVFEFGMGSGKNLKLMPDRCAVGGLDISFINVAKAALKNDIQFVMVGDENHLRHLCNFDICFTVSVLDHIIDINGIIQELQRIANVAVYLAETNDTPGAYYYAHNYESYGFTKTNFKWTSPGDGAVYYIWEWKKDITSMPVLGSWHYKGEVGNSFVNV